MDYDSQKGPIPNSNSTSTLPNVGKTKEKTMLVIGVVVLIGVVFYFIFSGSDSNSSVKNNQVKLIDQTIKEMEGTISSVDAKNSTFILSGSDLKEYTVATFPETTWSAKKDSILKKDTKVRVDYIDALRTIGMLYAADVEKIK